MVISSKKYEPGPLINAIQSVLHKNLLDVCSTLINYLNEQRIKTFSVNWSQDNIKKKGKKKFAEWLIITANIYASIDNLAVITAELSQNNSNLAYRIFDGHNHNKSAQIAAKILKETTQPSIFSIHRLKRLTLLITNFTYLRTSNNHKYKS
ncbi:hypothetical protein [Rickettsiales endosymbiont of Stachyamoeba lipophora]|uniref:hypothetical protein n=1 Tax=Rickettsiales endosymbiont of Stachyamoeba lipophora TaxID=2486578 RepID=UPI000F652554|nr:hypothetical protein [Rickettsiales endosymbiont of Stachyamoeba lipophora]AZL14960.1 hypothetical protein EF513_00035 [Rickettsiales endosymbiont of Stachyamoeba lipophora]